MPMSQWIALMPNRLSDIGIGLSGVVGVGRRSFGLEGAALADFVRRSLHALVERGAVPWQWGMERNTKLHYGSDTPEEIVEGVIADWLAGGDLEWGDFWFALPETFKDSR